MSKRKRKKSKNYKGSSEDGDIILYGKKNIKRRPTSSDADWEFWKLLRDRSTRKTNGPIRSKLIGNV